MNAYQLPSLSRFKGCIILRCVCFFLIFFLNYQSKANLCIHLDLTKVHRFKGLTSPYIIPYFHFLNLNNILNLPQTFVIAEAWFDTNYVRLVFCLPDVHACALVYEIKTNASRLYTSFTSFTVAKTLVYMTQWLIHNLICGLFLNFPYFIKECKLNIIKI